MSLVKVKGRELCLLYQDTSRAWQTFALGKSCALYVSTDAIETAPQTNWKHREFLPGKSDWYVTAAGIIGYGANGGGVNIATMVGATLQIAFCTVPDHVNPLQAGRIYPNLHIMRWGEAILIEVEETGNRAEMAQYSVTLQGTGELHFDDPPEGLVTGIMWEDPEPWADAEKWKELS